MGIIRAAVDTARGTLADQWLDVVEAGQALLLWPHITPCRTP